MPEIDQMQEVYEHLHGVANEYNARLIASGDETTKARVEAAGYRVAVIRSDGAGWSVMATDLARMAGRCIFAFPTMTSESGAHGVAVEFTRQ